MSRHPAWVLMVSGALTLLAETRADGAERESTDARADGDMMKRYLLRQVDQAALRWQADYEARTTPEEIAAYQKQSRQRLLAVMGGLPERSPLSARTTGKVEREGYVVEKVMFESQPHLHVTGLLFLPDPARFKPPYPGVVVPCGHYGNGKAHDTYQTLGALLALNGMTALVFDPIDQAERFQYHGERGPYGKDEPELDGVLGHQMVGVGCILLGRSMARYLIWDTMRAIDYLQSRPEVDPQRIGCTGHSGGGILTAYVVALDDRVQAAAPACYLNNLPTILRTAGPQDAEHHTWAAMSVGPQQTDLLMLRAPVPTLLCEGTKDYFRIDGGWDTIRCAKRLYTRLGFAERIDIIENDSAHNFDRTLREGVARWMSRWLLHEDRPISEPAIVLLTDKEAQCTPEGQVFLLPGARSAYDLNDDCENELAQRRAEAWARQDRAALLERVRRIAGIRTLAQLPHPRVEKGETLDRPGYRIHTLALHPEEGIVLPALLFVPEKATFDHVIVYVHERGKEADAAPGGRIERLVLGGPRVLAVELRGTGQSQQTAHRNFGPRIGWDWRDICDAYLLGRSYVGMRAEDVLVSARHAAKHLGGSPAAGVDLIAVGHVGVPALHAAALEPSLFRTVKLSQALVSWASVIQCHLTFNQYVNAVHGALLEYDLPDLAKVLGDKLAIDDARDGAGKAVAPK
jgi:dienelactone hydrolase